MKLPWRSPCKKVRCTSSAVGRLTRSGTLQRGLALHMVLSRTRRGSLPSAETMLSLPMAAPSGHWRAASLALPWNGTTHPHCQLPSAGAGGAAQGSALPESSCLDSAEGEVRPDHLPAAFADAAAIEKLEGMSCRMPAGTPSARKLCSLWSGSLVRDAKACRSFRRNGCPGVIRRQAGSLHCGCRKE